MSKQLPNLVKMDSLVKELVANAQQLAVVAKEAATEKNLGPLQARQEEIIANIMASDQDLTKTISKKELADHPIWQNICRGLDSFEALNAQFIQNMAVRKGLLAFELQEVREARSDLKKIKAAYVVDSKDGSRTRGTFDTVS